MTRKKKKLHPVQMLSEAPAAALDRAVTSTSAVASRISNGKLVKKSKDYWHSLGPGLTTGASDDDPSGIATYSQAGAQYGFNLLWLSPLTLPLMVAIQEMCARIGLVTGRGLAGNIRLHFPRRVLMLAAALLFAANALNIGADLGAMAKATQLIIPGLNFTWLIIGFTILSLALQIFTNYARYAKYLKWLALVLLAYVASALLARLDWGAVLNGTLNPDLSFNKDTFIIIGAVLGTTISPYLFFWQTSQEVEQSILSGKLLLKNRRGTTKSAIRSMRGDVWSGMILSNIVMFFIISAAGAVLHTNGVTEIISATEAAEALRPFAGDATYTLFAIGIIGTGLLAIPVLAGSSSYALSEAFKWKEGLYRPLKQAHAFYGVIILSMFAGLAINFFGISPFKALIYSAVANCIVAPVILSLIVLISSNKKVMGRWANRRHTTAIGWLTTGVMTIASVSAIIALF